MAANDFWDLIESNMPDGARRFADASGRAPVSYDDVRARSARFAHALTRLGVAPGDRVAAQVDKSIEALMLYLACLRCGAAFVPLNTAYTAAEIGYFIEDAQPALFICEPGRLEDVRKLPQSAATRVETLDADGGGSLAARMADMPSDFDNAARGGGDLAAILYTSGTTGRSKGAMLSHANLASNALALRDEWRFSADDVLIHALPIYHAHGLFVATHVTLLAGASLIFQRQFRPADVLAAMEKATVLMGVPTFYTRLLQEPGLDCESVRRMRLFISGSAPLLAETHQAWQARTGHAILERYGMTETGMNTSNPYEGDRRAGTVGFPLWGVEIRIADAETGAALAVDEVGMIEVRGPNVFSGYWRQPEKTAAEFRPDGFFITGDIGTIDARGYVRIVGRAKDLIITGGLNVYPKEVETEIDLVAGVRESAVIGVAHPDFGEAVTAIVVAEEGAALSESAILAALENRLARFKTPKRVMFAPELPRNAMGKVQKNVLRQAYSELYLKRER
ncbi:MAG: malonate--CoA ligase [Methylocystis sp.]|uniref:malonate--CoA ligase n=1 Tax=Methylocystis sp. TaxID=1911079 RepID=UPI003DA44301